ncbi:MAG: hypothetical protein ACREV9_02955 [Burkholderiales bacterium]
MAAMNQLKPLASLAAAAVIAVLNTLPTVEAANTTPKCGFTRALRIIESVEIAKEHSAIHFAVRPIDQF